MVRVEWVAKSRARQETFANSLATLRRGGQDMQRIPIEANPALAASAWIDVDLDAIAHNVRVCRRLLPPACVLIAVVKSNAYGHGMLRVARTALQHGATELAVASVHEGALLRDAGIQAPILVAGPVAPTEAAAVVQHALVPSLAGAELARALAAASRRFLPVHIEVDTGMSRHGVAGDELGDLVQRLHDRGRLTVAGVFTHFAPAAVGAQTLAGLRGQLQRFQAAVDGVRALRGVRRHACNSLAALALPAAHLDAVRLGGALYGFDPFHGAGEPGPVALRPALAWKARLLGIREVPPGTPVGYGGTFVTTRRSRLGLVPVGYADGLARELWHGAEVLVRGVRVPIVGQISMNQTILDLTVLPEVLHGDEVVLLGAQGSDRVLAEARVPPGGSVYEVTSLLRPGLLRRYLGGGSAGAERHG